MKDSKYARPEMLVETHWLARHLDQPGLRIVDARPSIEYRLAHIPGAVSIPIPGWYLKDPEQTTSIARPEIFKRIMENTGIGDDTQVIAYDDDGGHHAARLWWALEYYGHASAVRLLNGGWSKWLAEHRPVTVRMPRVPEATFTPRPDPSVLATADGVLAHLKAPGVVLLDVRSDGEWDGSNKRSNRHGGRIPGAVHIEWVKSVTADGLKTWRPAEELRRMYEAAGVTKDKGVIIY